MGQRIADGGFELVRRGALGVADQDQVAAENSKTPFVVVVLSGLKEEVVGDAAGGGQLFHFGRIADGHAGGGGQRQGGAASGGQADGEGPVIDRRGVSPGSD